MINTQKSQIEGYLTNSTTMFGRHYPLFHALEQELQKDKLSEVNCLIIGPGERWSPDMDKKFTNTYQPYELINILRRTNSSKYHIDVIDINPSVIAQMQKSPLLLEIYSDFGQHPLTRKQTLEEAMQSGKYYNTFLSDLVIESTNNKKIIQIPEKILSNIEAEIADVITCDLPKETYDIIICTVLLSHYAPAVTQRWINPVPETLKKIENSIKPNGYLMDSEKGLLDKGWQLLENFNRTNTTAHDCGAGLFKKKEEELKNEDDPTYSIIFSSEKK